MPDAKKSAELTFEAKEAVRTYMLSFFAIGGPIIALVAGIAGYLINDLAKSNATLQALQDIQRPLLDGNLKVAEALRNATALDEKVSSLSLQTERALADVREEADQAAKSLEQRAAQSVEAVKSRANEARQFAIDAENELKSVRKQISSIPNVSSLTASIENSATELASSGEFQDIVATKALEGIAGLVAAFDLPDGCPAGWSEFKEASGRVVVGVNGGAYTLPYIAGLPKYQTGGAETHTLTVEEMPKLSLVVPRRGNVAIRTDNVVDTMVQNVSYGEPSAAKPHNNLPPYIALYFCKKEGG